MVRGSFRTFPVLRLLLIIIYSHEVLWTEDSFKEWRAPEIMQARRVSFHSYFWVSLECIGISWTNLTRQHSWVRFDQENCCHITPRFMHDLHFIGIEWRHQLKMVFAILRVDVIHYQFMKWQMCIAWKSFEWNSICHMTIGCWFRCMFLYFRVLDWCVVHTWPNMTMRYSRVGFEQVWPSYRSLNSLRRKYRSVNRWQWKPTFVAGVYVGVSVYSLGSAGNPPAVRLPCYHLSVSSVG